MVHISFLTFSLAFQLAPNLLPMKRMEKTARTVRNLNVAGAGMGLARDAAAATMKIRAAGTSHPAAAGRRGTVPTTRLLTLTAAKQRAKRAVAGELSRVVKTWAMAKRI